MQGSRDWNRKDMSDSMIGQLQNAYNKNITDHSFTGYTAENTRNQERFDCISNNSNFPSEFFRKRSPSQSQMMIRHNSTPNEYHFSSPNKVRSRKKCGSPLEDYLSNRHELEPGNDILQEQYSPRLQESYPEQDEDNQEQSSTYIGPTEQDYSELYSLISKKTMITLQNLRKGKCEIHGKAFELLSLEGKKRLCAGCIPEYSQKEHHILRFEEAVFEEQKALNNLLWKAIELRGECSDLIFEDPSSSENSEGPEIEFLSSLKQIFKDKENHLLEEFKAKFAQIRKTIKEVEKEALKSLREKLSKCSQFFHRIEHSVAPLAAKSTEHLKIITGFLADQIDSDKLNLKLLQESLAARGKFGTSRPDLDKSDYKTTEDYCNHLTQSLRNRKESSIKALTEYLDQIEVKFKPELADKLVELIGKDKEVAVAGSDAGGKSKDMLSRLPEESQEAEDGSSFSGNRPQLAGVEKKEVKLYSFESMLRKVNHIKTAISELHRKSFAESVNKGPDSHNPGSDRRFFEDYTKIEQIIKSLEMETRRAKSMLISSPVYSKNNPSGHGRSPNPQIIKRRDSRTMNSQESFQGDLEALDTDRLKDLRQKRPDRLNLGGIRTTRADQDREDVEFGKVALKHSLTDRGLDGLGSHQDSRPFSMNQHQRRPFVAVNRIGIDSLDGGERAPPRPISAQIADNDDRESNGRSLSKGNKTYDFNQYNKPTGLRISELEQQLERIQSRGSSGRLKASIQIQEILNQGNHPVNQQVSGKDQDEASEADSKKKSVCVVSSHSLLSKSLSGGSKDENKTTTNQTKHIGSGETTTQQPRNGLTWSFHPFNLESSDKQVSKKDRCEVTDLISDFSRLKTEDKNDPIVRLEARNELIESLKSIKTKVKGESGSSHKKELISSGRRVSTPNFQKKKYRFELLEFARKMSLGQTQQVSAWNMKVTSMPYLISPRRPHTERRERAIKAREEEDRSSYRALSLQQDADFDLLFHRFTNNKLRYLNGGPSRQAESVKSVKKYCKNIRHYFKNKFVNRLNESVRLDSERSGTVEKRAGAFALKLDLQKKIIKEGFEEIQKRRQGIRRLIEQSSKVPSPSGGGSDALELGMVQNLFMGDEHNDRVIDNELRVKEIEINWNSLGNSYEGPGSLGTDDIQISSKRFEQSTQKGNNSKTNPEESFAEAGTKKISFYQSSRNSNAQDLAIHIHDLAEETNLIEKIQKGVRRDVSEEECGTKKMFSRRSLKNSWGQGLSLEAPPEGFFYKNGFKKKIPKSERRSGNGQNVLVQGQSETGLLNFRSEGERVEESQPSSQNEISENSLFRKFKHSHLEENARSFYKKRKGGRGKDVRKKFGSFQFTHKKSKQEDKSARKSHAKPLSKTPARLKRATKKMRKSTNRSKNKSKKSIEKPKKKKAARTKIRTTVKKKTNQGRKNTNNNNNKLKKQPKTIQPISSTRILNSIKKQIHVLNKRNKTFYNNEIMPSNRSSHQKSFNFSKKSQDFSSTSQLAERCSTSITVKAGILSNTNRESPILQRDIFDPYYATYSKEASKPKSILGDKEIEKVPGMLVAKPDLTKLVLSKAGITDMGAIRLISILASLKNQIVRIDLSHNYITERFLESILPVMRTNVLSVRRIRLKRCGIISSSVTTRQLISKLKRLGVSVEI